MQSGTPSHSHTETDTDLVIAAAAGVARLLLLELRGRCHWRKVHPILAQVDILAKFGRKFGVTILLGAFLLYL